MKRPHASMLTLIVFVQTFATNAFADAAACKTIQNAGEQLLSVPNRRISTVTIDGESHQSETITTRQAMYELVDGHWDKEPFDGSERGSIAADMSKDECQHVRDEPANGEPAQVFKVRHTDADGRKTESLMWISSTGLLLHQQMQIGDDKIDIRFEYKFAMPAGVR